MAEEANIEFSKEGMKLPYRRYLSDSAPGFIFMLFLIASYYNNYPVLGIQLSNLLPTAVSPEVRVFVLLLLSLLATPVGLTINVISWFFFESAQKRIEKIIHTHGILQSFKEEYTFRESSVRFGINCDNWFEIVRTLETALVNEFPSMSDRIEPLRGSAIFLRNLSFLCLIALVQVWTITPDVRFSVIFILLSLFFLCISAVTSFYFHVQIVFWSHILSRRNKTGLLRNIIDDLLSKKK